MSDAVSDSTRARVHHLSTRARIYRQKQKAAKPEEAVNTTALSEEQHILLPWAIEKTMLKTYQEIGKTFGAHVSQAAEKHVHRDMALLGRGVLEHWPEFAGKAPQPLRLLVGLEP